VNCWKPSLLQNSCEIFNSNIYLPIFLFYKKKTPKGVKLPARWAGSLNSTGGHKKKDKYLTVQKSKKAISSQAVKGVLIKHKKRHNSFNS